MTVIWKFDLREHYFSGCKILKPLSVQIQGDRVCFWALVDPTLNRHYQILPIGTGWNFDNDTADEFEAEMGDYIGSIVDDEAWEVWHYFMKEVEVEE